MLAVLGLVAGPGDAAAGYVGAAACGQCHEKQVDAWRGSHHERAMQHANDETVLGDFKDAEFTYHDVTSRFYRRDGRFFVRTDGPDGRLNDYEIRYTFGVEPLQQYLIEFPDGRLQPLGIAWDSRPAAAGGQRWFHLYPEQHISHDDPLHWTGASQNWNYMCAECHSTALDRNYDAEAGRYATTWSEINVSCEACHGPGAAHVDWARQAKSGGASSAGDDSGLALSLARGGQWRIPDGADTAVRGGGSAGEAQVESCGRCHARRAPVFNDYRHGQALLDTHRPQLLREGLYFADGQINDEVYVYGSFLQSRMHRQGVTCSDCHEPHSLQLRRPGNALCGGCHRSERYDTASHHFHAAGSEAAQCVACHMPARTYMVVDPRRDHSFRVPRPDLSVRLGTPNACAQCHQGRTDGWAEAAVKQWYGDDRRREPHFGTAVDAGRRGATDAEQRLIALVSDTTQPAIARATGAVLLGGHLSPLSVPELAALLSDPDPLLRLSALEAIEGLPMRNRARLAAGLLKDPVRLVRAEAGRVLAGGDELISEQDRDALQRALQEYIAGQGMNLDRPEALSNLGNVYLQLGRVEEAETAYQRAIALDPGFVPAYVNLADLMRAGDRDADAEQLLKLALSRQPRAGSLHYAYGLLLVRRKRLERALDELRRATELESNNARYLYVYAVALESAGRLNDALQALETAHAARPSDRDVLYALIAYHARAGNAEAARRYAAVLSGVSPWDRDAAELRRQLEARASRGRSSGK